MSSKENNRLTAVICMTLLAVQFGLQPILTRSYTSSECLKTTVVLVQEAVKFLLAYSMLAISGKRQEAFQDWSLVTWITVAGVPAFLYAIQNMAALLAYQNLDALSFNVLNQTKTLSAALNCYIIMKKKQSRGQVVALLLLLLSALIMERIITVESVMGWVGLGEISDESIQDNKSLLFSSLSSSSKHVTHGVLPILGASYLSGLAGALSQKNLQNRNPYLFSMELCAASSLVLVTTQFVMMMMVDSRETNDDNNQTTSLFQGFTIYTLIPIFTNACGGILVGLVTKYAGSVQKGFALIFGILLSGILQQHSSGVVSMNQVAGGCLAALSLYLHATNPPVEKTKQE